MLDFDPHTVEVAEDVYRRFFREVLELDRGLTQSLARILGVPDPYASGIRLGFTDITLNT